MLSERLRIWTQGFRATLARFLGRLGFTPNALTICGYLLNLPVMYVLATGHLRIGGVLVALASAFDALDGALARETGQSTTFGAFLDSVLDRYSEATVFFGLLLWYLQQGSRLDSALIYATIVGSLLVSYTRARAEGLGLECKTGWFTRFERIALLCIALVLGQVRAALWVMAILTNFTAMQRTYHVWRLTSGADRPRP
jgi:CDP-diacylglycerol--glycerol-3-phosphate 3-phosphatidyltransferase